MIRNLIIKNRSYRRFDSSVKLDSKQIKKWIELARFSGSGRNMQPLKYIICTYPETNDKIFPHLGWAGYLTNWEGPKKGERPVAYIAVLNDKSLSENYFCDDGIAMQSILLGAVEEGFGGCMIGTVNKNRVSEILQIPEHLDLLWIIALGKPAENCVIDEADKGNIKYWRDENEVHHVPKRSLNEIIFRIE